MSRAGRSDWGRRQLRAVATPAMAGSVEPVIGGILAGGRSRRMGTDKAHVLLGGVSLFHRVAACLAEVADEVVALGRSQPLEGIRAIPDEIADSPGPLAGLAAGLAYARRGRVLLVGVDQPLVRVETLAALVGMALPGEAVVPVDEGHRQVTCAVYPASWTSEAAAEALAGGSIQSLLDRMAHMAVPPDLWKQWGEDGRSWFSVDSADGIAELLTRFPDCGGADWL